jgi:DNA-formamidopyrimidine glycosylase
MPEGHTLFRLARDLTAAFAGRRVAATSPQGRFTDAVLIDGAVLIGAESAGKHLFVAFEDERWLNVHLGLIGSFDVHADVAEIPAPVGQVRLRLTSQGRPTAYADLRGAIVCELVDAERRALVLDRLGPDPLRAEADPDRAWQRIRRSGRPIGDLLLDQSVVAGVGNVYRAEVLFRQRIHPERPGKTLRVGQWRALWADLCELMPVGVATGRIDTVRPEHTPEAMGRPARSDDHGGEVYVYRRTGEPCLVCGSPIRTRVLGGRNSFWCSRCQPTFRSRAIQ